MTQPAAAEHSAEIMPTHGDELDAALRRHLDDWSSRARTARGAMKPQGIQLREYLRHGTGALIDDWPAGDMLEVDDVGVSVTKLGEVMRDDAAQKGLSSAKYQLVLVGPGGKALVRRTVDVVLDGVDVGGGGMVSGEGTASAAAAMADRMSQYAFKVYQTSGMERVREREYWERERARLSARIEELEKRLNDGFDAREAMMRERWELEAARTDRKGSIELKKQGLEQLGKAVPMIAKMVMAKKGSHDVEELVLGFDFEQISIFAMALDAGARRKFLTWYKTLRELRGLDTADAAAALEATKDEKDGTKDGTAS